MFTFSNAYAEIDLEALAYNYNEIAKAAAPAKVMAVVKADAYGHGAERCTEVLYNCGCRFFAVATAKEALDLRSMYADCEILILGICPNMEMTDLLCENNIIITLGSLDHAKRVVTALSPDKSIRCHLKLDTGMNRIGFSSREEDFCAIKEVFSYKNLKIEGMFSHFACSDMQDMTMTDLQYERYKETRQRLNDMGVELSTHHISNSAATLYRKDTCLDYVRCGIILYGLDPSAEAPAAGLKPIMSLKTHITHTHTLYKGESVGYGATYTAEHDMKIATIPIGYADGFIRAYANGGYMTVKGTKCPIVGRICMDQCMIDISQTDAQPGDEVEIFGKHTSVNVFARAAGSINYECVCLLSRRVDRVYL